MAKEFTKKQFNYHGRNISYLLQQKNPQISTNIFSIRWNSDVHDGPHHIMSTQNRNTSIINTVKEHKHLTI